MYEFEREEYSKHRICYENENLESTSLTKIWKKTTEPKKTNERIRLYEFFVKIFYNTLQSDSKEMKESYIEDVYENLNTKLEKKINKSNATNTDDLGHCVKDLFDKSSNSNIEEEPEKNDTSMSDLLGDDNKNSEEDDESSSHNDSQNKPKIHPLSTENIIEKGNEKLKEMNLGMVRIRLHRRNSRFEQFQDKIYTSLLDKNNSVEEIISKLKMNEVLAIVPSFRCRYRLMKKWQ